MRGITIVLLLLAALATGGYAKPRAQQTKGASHLDHEITNRVMHGDRSRHHEHPNQHHSAAAALPSSTSSSSSNGEHDHEHKHQHSNNRPADHTVHKKLLEQQEDELLVGERLMHVKPRKAQRLNATAAAGGAGKRKSGGQQPMSSKALKLAKLSGGQQGKLFSAAKPGRSAQGGKGGSKGGFKGSNPLTKEYKGRRQAKKYNPKKHAWKKTAHKDKANRNRQMKRDMKDKAMTKKEKVMNKEMIKAKELLRKEKALKKRERREKRAKVMAYRKRD